MATNRAALGFVAAAVFAFAAWAGTGGQPRSAPGVDTTTGSAPARTTSPSSRLATVPATARARSARADVTRLLVEATVPNALDRYKFDVGHYPTEEEGGLKALVVKPNFKDEAMGRNWQGPYLKAEPLDAWGRPIRYQPRAAGDSPTQGHSEYRLWSAGPDGKDGTEDDIRNWRE